MSHCSSKLKVSRCGPQQVKCILSIVMNKKGQATVLIGIIFQVVFIFFAMVINVGLLVNDKINLQNSVDIAAYYGAMKQAEVLNTMAHVNFQIRQAWKLMNWRLWALGDIGRFDQFLNGDISSATESELRARTSSSDNNMLNICTRNPFWSDEWNLAGNNPVQNFCKSANFEIPRLKPLSLRGVQTLPIFGFMRIFEAQSQRNANVFGSDCERGAGFNYYYAAAILASYKITVANKKGIMRELQNLLIQGNDFKDIMGASVRGTTENVFRKNLTLANKESIDGFEFYNSLNQNPFLVPIDVRVRMTYTDMFGTPGSCKGQVKDIIEEPQTKNGTILKLVSLIDGLAGSDYSNDVKPQSAEVFSKGTAKNDFTAPTSTVGFEKNPWVIAYVKVKAQTKPKMLFSPIGDGRVTLTAEAYAMPFGGKVGPWYKASWSRDQNTSAGPEEEKIDRLLPPRVGEASTNRNANVFYEPNYSRFPGDNLGMRSGLARTQGLDLLRFQSNRDRPSLFNDDYGNIIASLEANQFRQDPLVFSTSGKSDNLRTAEKIAVAPDLFDAAYYSIQRNFEEDFLNKKSGGFLNKLCPIGCEDFGTDISKKMKGQTATQTKPSTLEEAILRVRQTQQRLFWKIKDPDHLNTSWTQEAADRYLPLDGGPSELIAAPSTARSGVGGRSGYSVKIVSESFLTKPLALGGKGAGPGVILNPPK